MSDFAGCITIAVILAAFTILMAAHCRAQARTRRTYGITPRPWWRKPTATELADLRETGIDPHWQEVRRTLAAMQAKDITGQNGGPR